MIIWNRKARAHVTPFLNQANKDILKMNARRQLHLSCFLRKIVHYKRPLYLYQKVDWVKDKYERNTRGRKTNMMVVPAHKTQGFKGSFKYSAAKIWNDLPPPLKKFLDYLKDLLKLLYIMKLYTKFCFHSLLHL